MATKAEQVFASFCDYIVSQLESGDTLDPKALEQIVKFLKDQGVVEPADIPEADINPTLLKAAKNLKLQAADM